MVSQVEYNMWNGERWSNKNINMDTIPGTNHHNFLVDRYNGLFEFIGFKYDNT